MGTMGLTGYIKMTWTFVGPFVNKPTPYDVLNPTQGIRGALD
jgi:hypothetical protein